MNIFVYFLFYFHCCQFLIFVSFTRSENGNEEADTYLTFKVLLAKQLNVLISSLHELCQYRNINATWAAWQMEWVWYRLDIWLSEFTDIIILLGFLLLIIICVSSNLPAFCLKVIHLPLMMELPSWHRFY